MRIQLLLLGLLSMWATMILFTVISHLFDKVGLSLIRTDHEHGLKGMAAEYTASVVLSLSMSFSLAFLFVGMCSIFGVHIPSP